MTTTLHVDVHATRGDFVLEAKTDLPASGITVVFGRSGSGKTTLLRCLAGLERARGRVALGPDVWLDSRTNVAKPPEHRSVGYVFQEAALFPHLSVRGNLRYAAARVPKRQRRIGIDAATEWLGIGPLLDRSPVDLSGGERQRVAIARALVRSPALLAMDEPLAALDLGARAQILDHLERVRNELDVPIVYVTHAVDEAARLADRVVWLDEGRVEAVGSGEEVFARLDVGVMLGDDAASIVTARVARHDDDYHLTELDCDWGALFVQKLTVPVGRRVRLRLQARDVSLALDREERSSIMNVFPAEVVDLRPVGPGQVLVRLACPASPGHTLLARVMKKSVDDLGLRPGLPVFARLKGVSVR